MTFQEHKLPKYDNCTNMITVQINCDYFQHAKQI